MRDDAWAVVRIADRAGSTYLRGIVPYAILVGLGTWLGLEGAERLGLSNFQQTGAVATLAGAVQVIPEIGPLLGFVPALLALPVSWEVSLVYLASYLASRWLAGAIMGRRGSGRRLHPVLMVPAIVALTQLGWMWLFIAGPILAIGFDLVRYTYGRLSEPAAPAGVIPDEQTTDVPVATAQAVRPIPWSATVTTRG
jgi:predicted PurR-regulated permease PerM